MFKNSLYKTPTKTLSTVSKIYSIYFSVTYVFMVINCFDLDIKPREKVYKTFSNNLNH